MKTYYFTTLLLLFSTIVYSQPSYVPQDGLIAWWGFNNSSIDDSQFGNNGQSNNVQYVSNRLNIQEAAVRFTGSNSFVRVDNSSDLILNNNDAYSVSFWIKIESNPNNGPESGILSKWDEQLSSSYPIRIATTDLGNGDSRLTWRIFSVQPSSQHNLDVILKNDCYHFITYVVSDYVCNLYVNSEFVSSVNFTFGNFDNNHDYFIGKRNVSAPRLFKGIVDEMGIWNRALSDEEIVSLYRAGDTQDPDFCCDFEKDEIVETVSTCSDFVWIDGNTYSESTSDPIVYLTNSQGCDSIVQLDLTIYEPSETFDLQYSCGDFEWIDGNVYSESTSSPSIVLIDVNGCDSIVYLNLVVLDQEGAPEVVAPNDISVCVGEEVTLIAENPNGAVLTWSEGVVDGEPFEVTTSGQQTYVVVADLNGCIGTDQVVVTGIPAPPVFAGGNRLICVGEPVVLMAQGATTFEWEDGYSQGAVLFPSETTTYVVTGTDANGCRASDEFTVTVEYLSEPSFSGDELFGCEPHQVVFTSTTQPTPLNCEWTFGDGTTAIGCDQIEKTYQEAGVYDVSLRVTSQNGCSYTTTYNQYINVTPLPEADFVADKGRLDVNNTKIEFTNTSIGGVNYSWDFGDDSPLVNSFNANHKYDNEGDRTYVVTLVADNGPDCRDTARMLIRVDEVIVFYIPNSFTPDGDEFNQIFQPVFTSGFDPNDFIFKIFNRWGEIIFETRNPNAGWDGTYGGLGLVKEGTYVWTLEFKETMSDKRHSHNGHVTLIR